MCCCLDFAVSFLVCIAIVEENAILLCFLRCRERMDIILRSEFSLKAFFDMDSDGNNEVTKEEFLLYKILHMNLVDPDIIARIERQFNVCICISCYMSSQLY